MNMVANNIKRLRTQNNLTQEDLAEKMHVTRQTISNWETGKNQPDVNTLNSLASVFGTDINEIIYGNRKNEYPKYQKKYVKDAIVASAIIIAVIVIRIICIPYLRKLMVKTYDYGIETMLFSYVSEAAIFFGLGFCFVTVLSFWFDCSIKRKRKLFFILAIICAVPIGSLVCDYLYWKLISGQSPLYIFGFMIVPQWINPIVTRFLPAGSGVFTFFWNNTRSADPAKTAKGNECHGKNQTDKKQKHKE